MGAARAQRGLPSSDRRVNGGRGQVCQRSCEGCLQADREPVSNRTLQTCRTVTALSPFARLGQRARISIMAPERNAALHQQAGYMTATGYLAIRPATLRTGLGSIHDSSNSRRAVLNVAGFYEETIGSVTCARPF